MALIFVLSVLSVFQGMALPGIASLGLSPFFLFQLAFGCFTFLYWMGRGFSIPAGWTTFAAWFTAFCAFSIVSSITLPVIFDGMLVYAPKGGIDEQYFNRSVLHISSGNFAQAVFLGLYWIAALYFVTKKNIAGLEKYFEKSYTWTAAIVLFFGYYQAVSIVTGIYFPKEILLSNEAYGLANETTIGILPRIHSVFSEPSFYAIYLTGVFAWVYVRFLAEESKKARFFLLLILAVVTVGLFLSLSTLGYMAVVIFLVMHSAFLLFSGRNARHLKFILILCFSILGICLILYYFVDGFDIIFDAVLFTKGDSDSSKHRLASDIFALDIVKKTYLLGVGLGSNRPSSFLTFLLSNVGVIGTALAILCGYLLMVRSAFARKGVTDPRRLVGVESTGWAITVMLVAKVLGGSELNFPPMWILIFYHIICIRSLAMHPNDNISSRTA